MDIEIKGWITEAVPCRYLEGRAWTLFCTSVEYNESHGGDHDGDDLVFFTDLLWNGYVREGDVFYINQCEGCNACTNLRVPVDSFKPSKSQRGVLRRNSDVRIMVQYVDSEKDASLLVTDEKVNLFREYYNHHNESSPEFCFSFEQAKDYLVTKLNGGYSRVVNMCYYIGDELVAVGVLDLTCNDCGQLAALSSRYFYYSLRDDVLKRSIGVFSVLKEIEFCRKHGIKCYYLGTYIKECRKLSYKANYRPYEVLLDGVWVRHGK